MSLLRNHEVHSEYRSVCCLLACSLYMEERFGSYRLWQNTFFLLFAYIPILQKCTLSHSKEGMRKGKEDDDDSGTLGLAQNFSLAPSNLKGAFLILLLSHSVFSVEMMILLLLTAATAVKRPIFAFSSFPLLLCFSDNGAGCMGKGL